MGYFWYSSHHSPQRPHINVLATHRITMNHPDIIMEDEAPRRGRPPKEKEKSFDELSEDEKILHTYVQGNFDSSVCKAIQISKEEFDQRLKDDSHFQRVVSFGRTLCQAWWEEKYVGAAAGAKVPAATMV